MWNSSECRIPTSVCYTMNNCLDWIASRKHVARTHVASADDGGCACRIQRVRFVDVLIFARAAVLAGSLRSMFVSNVPALG